jgi:hypothetical protein
MPAAAHRVHRGNSATTTIARIFLADPDIV